jgi:hypothetical protein
MKVKNFQPGLLKVEKAVMRNKLRSAAILISVFGLLAVPGWSQCIMCATALGSSPEGRALAGSFRYGIMFLLVVPYLIMGSIGYAIFRACRKQTAAAARIPVRREKPAL